MADSIFTKIINHDIPADIIYEDEHTVAFLDISPVNKGHTLVVPKTPFENIFDGDEALLGHMMKVAKKLSPIIMDAVGAEGVNLVMNNGAVAGQEVFHAHLHIIPRHKGDNSFAAHKCEGYKENEAAALATQINATVASAQ